MKGRPSAPSDTSSNSLTQSSNADAAYLKALCRAVPYHVVRDVLDDPQEQNITHEFFEGSVMFADLVGFTRWCEALAAQGADGLSDLSRRLDVVFAALLDQAIFPYGGYVIQFGGDSLTVVFRGADQISRGIASALICQRVMRDTAPTLLRPDVGGAGYQAQGSAQLPTPDPQPSSGAIETLQLRVGIATGPIGLPVLGDVNRRVVVCAGPTAHRALTLQNSAAPGSVVVDRTMVEIERSNLVIETEQEDRAQVSQLHTWPPIQAREPWGDGLQRRVKEKIALLQPFVPQPLGLRLRTAPEGWRFEGELRQVAVLFTEIWGLDRRLRPERMGPAPDVARSLLRAFRKHGGLVAKADLAEQGHRVMVLFGTHEPSDFDAERAVLAGLEATQRVKAYEGVPGFNITMRTGVHVGRVYFGAIGSERRHDITVVGDAVNTAARVAAAAGPFQVWATDSTLAGCNSDFRSEDRGPMSVKGKTTSVVMHWVQGISSGGAHYAQVRDQSRFCAGRTKELAFLKAAVEQGLSGSGQVVGICGPRGTGKSHLLSQTLNQWVLGGGRALIGRCRYATRSVPLAPVIAMFERFFGLTSETSEEERRIRIHQGLSPYALDRGAPELVALLQPARRPDGVAEALIDLADVHARERVLASITEFLHLRMKEAPVLYVLEDIHLADTLTLQLVQRQGAFSRDHQMLLLGTYRPDPMLDDFRSGLENEIELRNLQAAATSELVAQHVGAAEVDPDLAVFLWQQTGGNPGYVLELTRFLRERHLLRELAGRVVPGEGSVASLEDLVPQSLAETVMVRIDQLRGPERRLLRIASAIGRRFELPVLWQLARSSLSEDGFASAVDTLQGLRLIVPSVHEEQGFMFRDSATRAVTYQSVPPTERRQLHVQIADRLSEQEESESGFRQALIGSHRFRAGQFHEAARRYGFAARVAAHSGLDREALDYGRRWREAIGQSNAPASRKKNAGMTLLILVSTARLGDVRNALKIAQNLRDQYDAVLSDENRCVLDYWWAEALVRSGDPQEAAQKLNQVYARTRISRAKCDAALLRARIAVDAGEVETSQTWCRRAAERLEDDPTRKAQLTLLEADTYVEQGELVEAKKIYERLWSSTRRRDHLHLASAARRGAARCDRLAMRFSDAEVGFQEVLRLDRALRRSGYEALDLVHLGQTYIWSGSVALARQTLIQALALSEELGHPGLAGEARVHLGMVKALENDLPAGWSLCERGQQEVLASRRAEAEMVAYLHLLNIALLQNHQERVAEVLRRCASFRTRLIQFPLFDRTFRRLSARAEQTFGRLQY